MRLFRPHSVTTEQLIERYQQPLYWHIRRMVVSHDDAQAVLQETFIQIHTHLAELRQADSERAWVYRIATNEALQWLRAKHEFLSLEEDDASPLINTLMADTYTNTGDALVLLMQEAVLALPTMQRTVFQPPLLRRTAVRRDSLRHRFFRRCRQDQLPFRQRKNQ